MVNSPTSLVQRQQLQKHRTWAAKYGISAADIRPQTLILYAPLQANKDTYTFDVSEKVASVLNTEVRLKDSSLFFANLFGLGLLKVPVLSNVQYPAAGKIVHYADKTIFAAAGTATALSEAQAVNQIFHSRLTFNTDQGVRLDAMACEVFESAPDTQSGAAAQPSAGLSVVDLSTSFYIFGDRKNTFQLQLPPNSERTNIGGTAAGVNYLALAIGGFEVVNAANSSRVKDFARYIQSAEDRP
jgi:hypothetical protein